MKYDWSTFPKLGDLESFKAGDWDCHGFGDMSPKLLESLEKVLINE